MANEKVKPTQREVRLAKMVSGFSLGVDALLRHREKITEVLSEICEHIDESTEAAMVELDGLNRDLRESMPELFSGVEEPANCDEDSEDSEPPLAVGQWVKIKKPAKNDAPNINWHNNCMDRFDGKIMQISFVFSMVGSRSDTLQWYVKLEGAEGDPSLGEPYVRWSFDPAWLTPLPDLPEGWRYLQPEELVAAGDELCALVYLRCADWWASGNVGREQAANGVYRRRTATEAKGEAAVAEAPKHDKEIQPGTKVKILHPDCLGRTGITSWENCPFPDCLFVWVDSEDPVLRVGAIPILKRYLAPLS